MTLRKLCSELTEKARLELNEDPERIEKDIQAFKDWIAKQNHLKSRVDDQWLIAFLRGCKYSLERCKEKYDTFYAIRSVSPEMCLPYDPMDPLVQEIISSGVIVPLPKLIKPGDPRVIIIRPGRYDPNRITPLNILRVNYMTVSVQLFEDDNTVVAGQIFIIDFEKVTSAHITQFTPMVMKKCALSGEETLPLREKGYHFINLPSGVETLYNIFKQFFNDKMKQRLHVHGKNIKTLHDYVSKSILPSEYGGNAGPIQNMIDNCKNELEKRREFFLEETQFKSDESKRIGKPKSETLFGAEGSFRQLNVD